MTVAIGAAAQAALQSAGMAGTQTVTAGAAPFADVVSSLVQSSAAAETKAHEAVAGLMNGTGAELHDVMIATQKADLQFELALEMRNKAVAAYQQMMSTQF